MITDNEKIILKNLISNETYARKILPFLKKEYFQEQSSKLIFDTVYSYFEKYKQPPSYSALKIDIQNKNDISAVLLSDSSSIIGELEQDNSDYNFDWTIKLTEDYCKERALFNGIMSSINIMEGNTKQPKTAIPQILQEALAVSLDSHIGHKYLNDAQDRFQSYKDKEVKIPFDLEMLNVITNGGVEKKTINLILAGTNIGKTVCLCNLAASYLLQGLNVLYITLEMSEKQISKRIDANLLDIPIDELSDFSAEELTRKITRIKGKINSEIVVREFPTSSANSLDFTALIEDLKLKEKFVPDILVVDYLSICASSKYKPGSCNSYTYYKSIAEELRAIGVVYNIPVWSAMQVNRSGFSNSDADIDDTSESFGVPMTADFMLLLTVTDELIELNQILCKQVKSRYGNKNKNKRFVIGMDRDKMRFYNLDDIAQEGLLDGPIMDNTKFGQEDMNRGKKKGKKFDGFKI